jgi:S-methylmethionine-dependent homocysteine/selenocysteine methylase
MIFLDGALGSTLLDRANKSSSGLWSAQFLLDDPEAIKALYEEYIAIGSDLITTNTYSTIPSYLNKEKISAKMPELIDIAGKLAKEVADRHEHVRVAGSLPPLEESYRPDLVLTEGEALPIYKTLIEGLLPYVDIFLCETISSVQETQNVLKALDLYNKEIPIWLSWTLKEDKKDLLRSGESIEEAFKFAEKFNPEAYLFNCTDPNAISSGLEVLQRLTDKPIGGYPNVFSVPDGWTLDNDVETLKNDLTKESFSSFCQVWQEKGASIFGGCCGVGPELMAEMIATLKQQN